MKKLSQSVFVYPFLYNCVLSDDGQVMPTTCRSWCVV